MTRMMRGLLLGLLPAALPVLPALSSTGGFLTPEAPFITLDPSVPAGSSVKAIISSGEFFDGIIFEGLPDGIGIVPAGNGGGGPTTGTVDVYVAHEQTTVPFFGESDFQDASVTKLTLDTTAGPQRGAVLHIAEAISPDDGFLRLCSASMATPFEGFDTHVLFANEEANDIVDVPPGAPYEADPSLSPMRQAGYAVALDTATGDVAPILGMGRLNHENTIALPGYNPLVLVTTDDTFSPPSAQLYMYLAQDQDQLFDDKGSLWAFRVTEADGKRVRSTDPFNGANDYLDLSPGEEFQGRFIRVPKRIARGLTADAPQDALEQWSNEHNVFQFIRLEDLAYDKNNPRIVYVADTGRGRVVPDPSTGRMTRGPSGTTGLADNGRIFKFVFNEKDPRLVDSLTVLADGDTSSASVFVPFVNPDNLDTSTNSLMVQEDHDDAKIWRHDFGSKTWSVVATVNDPDGESSGIVDASAAFGPGTWLLDVQGHGSLVNAEQVGEILFKREAGQLMLMEIPGS